MIDLIFLVESVGKIMMRQKHNDIRSMDRFPGDQVGQGRIGFRLVVSIVIRLLITNILPGLRLILPVVI